MSVELISVLLAVMAAGVALGGADPAQRPGASAGAKTDDRMQSQIGAGSLSGDGLHKGTIVQQPGDCRVRKGSCVTETVLLPADVGSRGGAGNSRR